MKKYKKFTVAIASMLLAFSAASAVTGTVAWFTAANTVSVSGMNIQADVEQGIVIANETHAAAADWDLSATASHNGEVNSAQAKFIPTSTYDGSHWYHANSTSFNDAGAGQATDKYESLTPTQNGSTGVYTATIGSGSKNIYLKNTFYIQSSNAEITGQDIYLTKLTVTGNTSSPELDKALRLAIVYNGNTTIFGLLSGYTASYTVGGASSGNSVSVEDAISTNAKVDVASNVTIPAYTVNSSNLQFDTYLYFEGEDAACKSANAAATLDTLAVSFTFGNEATGA